jgi:hypothetical protein
MSDAPLKVIGIILLVILISSAGLVSFGWPLRHPFHIFPFTLSLSILWIVLAVWVYRDAENRGMNGVLWALLVIIGSLVGLLIYLIVRSERKSPAPEAKKGNVCPSCAQPLTPGYKFCPHCGKPLEAACPACGKPAENSWKTCPHCGQQLPEK